MHDKFTTLLLALCLITSLARYSEAQPQNTQLQRLDKTAWPAGVVPQAELPTQGKIDYAFEGVDVSDIEGWLKWIGVEIPVSASGQISGWVWAQRGSGGWLSLRDYRVEAEITSPNLGLDRWSIESARLRFGYQQGVWYVGNLQGDVAELDNQTTKKLGTVNFAARVPLQGERIIAAETTIDSINLTNLLQSFGVDLTIQNRGGQVQLIANAPLDNINDISRWNARASVQLNDLKFDDMQPLSLNSQLDLASGNWTITNGQGAWANQSLQLQGTGQVDAPYAFNIRSAGSQLLLSELLANLGQPNLDLPITGRANITAQLSGDATLGFDNASVTLASNALDFRELPLNNVNLQFNYRTNQSQLVIRSLNVAGGSLSGDANWGTIDQITNGLPNVLHLSLTQLPLETLQSELTHAQLLKDPLPVQVGGVASGDLLFTTDAKPDETRWSSTGELMLADFGISQAAIGNTSVTWSKDAASDQLNLNVRAANGTIQARVTGQLRSADAGSLKHTEFVGYSATGNVRDFATRIPLNTANITVPLRATGDFQLQGTPSNWLDSGNAQLANVSFALNNQVLELEQAVLSISPEEFRLQRFQLFDQRGRIAGAGIYRRQAAGDHLINLRVADVDLAPLAASTLPAELATLKGIANFEIRLAKAASQNDLLSAWTGTFEGDLADLHFNGTSVGELALQGQIEDEQLTFELDGDLLHGDAHAAGSIPMQGLSFNTISQFVDSAQAEQLDVQSLRFEASLKNIDVRYLAAMRMSPREAAKYAGTVSLEVHGHGTNDNDLQIDASLESPWLKHGRVELAKDFLARVTYANRTLQITEIAGKVAEGRITARGSVLLVAPNAEQRSGGELVFDAQRMQINGIVRLLNPDYAEYYAGMFDYRGKIRVDGAIVLDGNASITNGIAYDIPVQDTRGSLRIAFSKAGAFEVLTADDLNGVAIGGDFAGSIVLRGGSGYQLSAAGRVNDGKLDQLSKALGFERIVGTGRFDGRIDLNSRNVSSLAALNGQVQINFENGDAQSVPVLSEVGRYVPVLQLASTDITAGTLHARIGDGVLRIQDFLLTGDSFWMIGEGNASLIGSQLDINAVLQTGGGLQQQLSQTIVQRLVVNALPSAALVTRLNDVIRNRSLYFHIGGTTNRPAVQARAGLTLGKLVLQNVLRNLTVAPIAASTASQSQ